MLILGSYYSKVKMKKLEENVFISEIIDGLKGKSTLAIGSFGSAAYQLKEGSDVDLYVLSEDRRGRSVTEGGGYMVEIFHANPEAVRKEIESRDVRTVAMMRSSRPLYDPRNIYSNLIETAKNQNLRHPEWLEKTIIGGEYDMVERTSESVEKELSQGNVLSAANSIRYLVDRIVDIGLRRLNVATQAKPERVPGLMSLLPTQMTKIYEGTFKCSEDYQVSELMQFIKNEKENLFPN